MCDAVHRARKTCTGLSGSALDACRRAAGVHTERPACEHNVSVCRVHGDSEPFYVCADAPAAELVVHGMPMRGAPSSVVVPR